MNYIKTKPKHFFPNKDSLFSKLVKENTYDNGFIFPILTKYEKTEIIGRRAKELTLGAKPKIPFDETK